MSCIFACHVTSCWDTTTHRTEDDEGRLRRFFLNWGLKESYVKAVGQGLGFNLRRISFAVGDRLDCYCCCNGGGNSKRNPDPIIRDREEQRCSCEKKSAVSDEITDHNRTCSERTTAGAENRAVSVDGDISIEQETGHVCQRAVCGVGVAHVEVDGVPRNDWSFRIYPLPNGYAACVARGPPSECSASGQTAGVITDPSVRFSDRRFGARNLQNEEKTVQEELERGLALPQTEFIMIGLGDILPGEARAAFFPLGKDGKNKNG